MSGITHERDGPERCLVGYDHDRDDADSATSADLDWQRIGRAKVYGPSSFNGGVGAGDVLIEISGHHADR